MVMAIPLALLVGAGLAGSVIAKEGSLSLLSGVSDFVSGVKKIVLKNDDSGSLVSRSHSQNDSLLAQVKHIEEEIRRLALRKPMTIVTDGGTGSRKYSIIIVALVAGYGYVWWKGWKLPDMMFATKRSLSDACNSVAKQLDDVNSSISAGQRQLSSKITSVDQDVNKIVEISQATNEEVSLLRVRSKVIGEEFQYVRDVESKLIQIEGKQDLTVNGVKKLCDYAITMDQASRTAIEPPAITPSLRAGSLPSASPLMLPSPSDSNASQKNAERLPKNAVSHFGLKEFNGVLDVGESSNGTDASINGLFGGLSSASVLTRSCSVTNSVAQVLSMGA